MSDFPWIPGLRQSQHPKQERRIKSPTIDAGQKLIHGVRSRIEFIVEQVSIDGKLK